MRFAWHSSLARRVVDAALPSACLLCGEDGPPLCPPCRADARDGRRPCCVVCALPLATDAVCGRCLARRPAFDATVAGAVFRPPLDRLVRELKYGARLHHAPTLAELIEAALDATRVDVLVAVPLSRRRLAMRGFNQSAEIARALARALRLPLDATSVLRVRDTPPQASLRFDERRTNMRGAFALALDAGDAFRDRAVGVVDDVMTTGATLDAFARTLKRGGARRVINLVAARTP